MNLRQLRYFVTIVEEGSVTRGAERMHVAQPSVSQQIRALEKELGGALLERLPKGVQLTAAGRVFIDEARAALAHADRAERLARSALNPDGGQLDVVTVTSIAYGQLPPILESWRGQHPAVTLQLREFRHRDALERAVANGLGDIAIGPIPRGWTGMVEPLGWEEFVVVLPTDDPLATRTTSIALEDLADRDWVLFDTDHGLSELIRLACARAGFVPRASVVTGQVASAAYLVAAGMGVTVLPSSVVPTELSAAVRRLRAPITRELAAFARKSWSPQADAFLRVALARPWGTRPRNAIVVS